jgi:NAD-dependent dihydropyrimidine dehydrogenase PreA subunit
MPPVIDMDKCTGCGTCDLICPLDVIYMDGEVPDIRYPEECWHCGACRQDCPSEAIGYAFPLSMLGI